MTFFARLLPQLATLVAVLLLTNPAYAGIWGVLTYEESSNSISIVDCETNALFVSIPETINNIQVSTITKNAFNKCESLTSVEIPHSVTHIENSAFSNCKSLKEINVSENNPVYSSQDGVIFSKDKAILYIYPAGKTDIEYIVPIGTFWIWGGAFSQNYTLASVILQNGLQVIWGEAFLNCTSLMEVKMADGLNMIGRRAFAGCVSLRNVLLPNSIETIEDYAFENCISMDEITIPKNTKHIGFNPFKKCTSLVKIRVALYNTNYTNHNGILFANNWSLICYPAGRKDNTYIVPSFIINLQPDAFAGCLSLTKIIFSGNAPIVTGEITDVSPNLNFYRRSTGWGFTSPTWQGYPIHTYALPSAFSDIVETDSAGWWKIHSFGWLYTSSDDGWIWHAEHGAQWVYPDGSFASQDNFAPKGVFLWDQNLNRWLWTSADYYPWMHEWGATTGWIWYYQGGIPTSRWFSRNGSPVLVAE